MNKITVGQNIVQVTVQDITLTVDLTKLDPMTLFLALGEVVKQTHNHP